MAETEETETPNQDPETTKDEQSASAGSAPTRTQNVITMPSRALAKIKTAERDKATKAAKRQLDAQAREMGFADHAALMAFARTSKETPPPAPAAAPTEPAEAAEPRGSKGKDMRDQFAQERERLLTERRRINRARAQEERARKTAERKLEAQEAEMVLRVAAASAGVQDVEFAMHVLKQHLGRLSADELSAFDETEYFRNTLRKERPFLYAVREEPASTSPEQSEPSPNTPKKEDAPSSMKDARVMSAEELRAHLLARGLTPPAAGMPS